MTQTKQQFKVQSGKSIKAKRRSRRGSIRSSNSHLTNRSQSKATPLDEIVEKKKGPITKIDNASKSSHTKRLENLRKKVLKQL